MGRDIKSQKVRERIIAATRDLFLEKGYADTTIREISLHARVSTGSIYHFFETKDGIFLHLLQEVFSWATDAADAAARSEDDPYLQLSIELGLMVHLFSSDRRTASLFAAAYRSWTIKDVILKLGVMRNRALLSTVLPKWDEGRYFSSTLTIAGILSAQVDERIHLDRLNREQRVQALLRAVLPVFEADPGMVEATLRAAMARLRSKSLASRISSMVPASAAAGLERS